MKKLKFDESLIDSVLSGKKDSTWRVNDDKNLTTGDILSLINSKTKLKIIKFKLLN